jgi:acyl-CoA dehydrogenase
MANDSLVAETARRIFSDLCDPQTVNRAPDDAWKGPAWAAIEEAGLPLAWVPDPWGGSGGETPDGFAVLREAGRFAVPLPIAETLLAGWLLWSAALQSPKGPMACGPMREGDRVTLGKDGKLHGHLHRVAFAKEAQHLALLVERESGGYLTALVEAGAARILDGVSIAGDACNTVILEGVQPVAMMPIVTRHGLDRPALLLMGAAMRSMQMAGALEAILDLSVAYANDRVAFGRPIAKFQAVQHNLARLAGEVATAMAAAGSASDAIANSPFQASYYILNGLGADIAAAMADAGASSESHAAANASFQAAAHDLPSQAESDLLRFPGSTSGLDEGVLLEVASAKIRVGEAAGEGAAIAHQVLGAIGFTQEHVLHRYTRRLWAWRDDFGSESVWAVKLGRVVAAKGADALWPMLAAR